MKKFPGFGLAVLVGFAIAASARADEVPQLPKPTKEHAWLQQLAGEWEVESEMTMPGQPAMKARGTETARMLGEFWLIGESQAEMMGMKMKSILTLGYDQERKKFVGSWVDSCTGHMWTYEGTLDESGKALTLTTRGPCPCKGGAIVNFREVLEIQDKGHKVFTSSMQDEKGNWQKFVTVRSKRKK